MPRKYNRSKARLTRKYGKTMADVNASVLQAAVRRLPANINAQIKKTLFKNAETKTSQATATDNLPISHNNAQLITNNILATTQGIGDPENQNTANRIGDKITLLRAEFRMMLELNQRYSDVSYRVMLVKSAKGDVPTTATLFNGLSGNKMLDTFNYERFSLLYQKWGKIKAPNHGGVPFVGGVSYVGSGLVDVTSNQLITMSRSTKIVKFNIPGSKFAKDGIIQYEANNSTQQKFFDYSFIIYAYSNFATSEALGWEVLHINDYFHRLVYKDF